MRVRLTKGNRAPGMDLSYAQVAKKRKKPWKGNVHQVFDKLFLIYIHCDALSYSSP